MWHDPLPAVGTVVRSTTAMHRYPHFIVAAGQYGIVTEATADPFAPFVAVRMFATVDGAEEWHNEVHFSDVVEYWDTFAPVHPLAVAVVRLILQSAAHVQSRPEVAVTLSGLLGRKLRGREDQLVLDAAMSLLVVARVHRTTLTVHPPVTIDPQLADRIAVRFAEMIRAELAPWELGEVIRRNREDGEDGEGDCHTHDFIDANDVMHGAMHHVRDEEFPDLDNPYDRALWNAAWTRAAKADFLLGFRADYQTVDIRDLDGSWFEKCAVRNDAEIGDIVVRWPDALRLGWDGGDAQSDCGFLLEGHVQGIAVEDGVRVSFMDLGIRKAR